MNNGDVCRLCLGEYGNTLKSLLNWTYNSIPFCNIYFELVGITYTEYPSGKICQQCEMEMMQAYKFREKCLETEEKLRNLSSTTASGSNIEFIPTTPTEKPEEEEEDAPSELSDTDVEESESDGDEIEMPRQTKQTKRIVHKFSRRQLKEMESKNIQCRRCNVVFRGIDLFRKHSCNMQDPREHPPKDGATKKLHTCVICGQTYTSRSCYNSHMDRHSNTKRYSCEHCGKKFSVWISRRTHIYKVHLKKFYCDCPHCGKGFYTQHQLKKHIDADHLDISPYQCVVCGKTFKQSSNLRGHEKIHEGPKSCEICGKALKTMACLRQHMRTHSDERNYICPVCSKGFTCNFSMKTHVRKLHPDDVHLLPPDGTIVNQKYLRKLQANEENSD